MVQIHEVEQVDRHQLSRHRGRRSRRLPRKQVKKCRAEGLLYKKSWDRPRPISIASLDLSRTKSGIDLHWCQLSRSPKPKKQQALLSNSKLIDRFWTNCVFSATVICSSNLFKCFNLVYWKVKTNINEDNDLLLLFNLSLKNLLSTVLMNVVYSVMQDWKVFKPFGVSSVQIGVPFAFFLRFQVSFSVITCRKVKPFKL